MQLGFLLLLRRTVFKSVTMAAEQAGISVSQNPKSCLTMIKVRVVYQFACLQRKGLCDCTANSIGFLISFEAGVV